MHARASIERQADKKKAPPVPLPSRAFSHTRGHLRVSRASLDGLRKKETARSLLLQSKTWVPLWYRDFSYSSFDSFTRTQQICKLHFLAFFPLACTFPLHFSNFWHVLTEKAWEDAAQGLGQVQASHSQAFARPVACTLFFLRPYKVMPFCDISETRDGRETLQESNSERNTRDLQPGSQGSLLLAP